MKPSRLFLFPIAHISLLLAALAPTGATFAATSDDEPADKAAWTRMVDLNKKAFAFIQAHKFDAAKDALLEALVVGKDANLQENEMMARTHVHLAAVYVTGEKNRDKGVNQFMLALKINPKITMTKQLDTPALKSAYLLARRQMETPTGADSKTTPVSSPPPQPDPPTPAVVTTHEEPAAPVAPVPSVKDDATTITKRGRGGHKVAVVVTDPDLPAKVPAPLYCPVAFEIPPGQDLIVRCLTQKQQKKSTATLFYRPEGGKDEDFQSATMSRSSKGWLQATVPGDAIKGKSLGYYIQAHVPGSSETLSLGRPDAPSAFMIKEGADASASADKENILDTLNVKVANEDDARRNHRREPGALWLSLAGGSGIGFHGKENLDGESSISSVAGFTPAGLFQAELELGYQLDKNLSISAMGRYQSAPADSSGYTGKSILTAARAAYLRARYAFWTASNFQTYASVGAGGGNNFLIVISKQCDASNTSPTCKLKHSDTLHGGPVGIVFGLGAIYHLNRTFGIFLDVNEIATLPKFMALTEVNLGLSIAYKLEKAAAPAVNEEGVLEKPRESESDTPDGRSQ